MQNHKSFRGKNEAATKLLHNLELMQELQNRDGDLDLSLNNVFNKNNDRNINKAI